MKKNSFLARMMIFIEKYIAWAFLSLLRLTYRYQVSGESYKKQRAIFIIWHQNIIPLLLLRTYEDIGVIISSSFDGELIAAPATLFGYQAIRGSSSRNSISALKEMISFSRKHSIAVTPDGPKGPAHKIKEGALFLAHMTKLPLIPVVLKCNKKWQFNSWDHFILPKPFSINQVLYCEPIYITNKEDIETKAIEIEELMEKRYKEL